MIKVSLLYPNGGDTSFDMDYYLNRHIPMLREALGSACKGLSIDAGVAGGTPDAPPPYVTIIHVLFASVEAFQAALALHAEQIFGDIPNFTNVQPITQISEVKL